MEYISRFSVNFVHRPGKDNIVADALSRPLDVPDKDEQAPTPCGPKHGITPLQVEVNAIDMPTVLSAQAIAEAQAEDDELESLIKHPSCNIQLLHIEGCDLHRFVEHNMVRPYLPKPLRRTAFDVVHGPTHIAGRSTAADSVQKFF